MAVLGLVVAGVVHAVVAPSKFEGGDGDTFVTTTGNTDWDTVAGLHVGTDLASGSGDNAFGQGTKEDNSAVTVVTGSIPPNKNDLTAFAVASENVSGQQFVYLAWERAVNIGNANLDFEINQHATTGFTSGFTGPLTLNRTVGDILVTYDFSGSGKPTLGFRLWTGSAWGASTTLTGANSEGAVNTKVISDPKISGNGALGIGLFGEASINLTGAGIFPPNTCEALGTVFVKSRSSSSFTAEIKDFIAPVALNVNTCATVHIHKVTNPTGGTGFSFTHNITSNPTVTSPFSLNDGGTQDFTNVLPGSYSVTESAKTNWDLTGLTCTKSGAGTTIDGTSTTTGTASFTVGAGGVVDCTYTNTERAHIIIKKVTNPNTDTTTLFTYTPSYNSGTTFQLKNGGQNDSGAIVPGSYTVNESGIPTNWSFTSVSCTSSGGNGSTGTQHGTTAQVDITLHAGDTVTCTYTNSGLGSVKIVKETIGGFSPPAFPFTSTGGPFSLSTTAAGVAGEDSTTFNNLSAGSTFNIAETPVPGSYDLTSVSCSDGTNGNLATGAVTVTVPLNATTTCTYVDTKRFGAIQITKTSIKGNAPLAGVTFDISTDANDTLGVIHLAATGATGIVCQDGLPWSGSGTTYYVTETGAPSGYKIDTTAAVAVPVTKNSTCGDANEAKVAFTDTPLSQITVSFHSVVAGATTATISCTGTPALPGGNDANPTPLPDGTPRTLGDGTTGLVPGTYTCTVVIDP